MHHNYAWLQLFADGTGEGAATSGVTPAAAGQDSGVTSVAAEQNEQTTADKLRELGVPSEKLKRAKYNQKAAQQPEVKAQAAAAEESTEANNTRLTWQQIMEDPEYNTEMQKVVQARTAKAKQSVDSMEKLAPALQMLAKKYSLEETDIEGIAKAVVDDDEYYEARALEMGVDTAVVKQLDHAERAARIADEQRQQFINEQKLNEHIADLQKQAVELKQKYPEFDLRKELDNQRFARMTAPDQMFSLEEAYELIHRDEIKENIRQAALQASRQQISNAIQSNRTRPAEGGASKSNNASVQTFNYKNATKEQREALKSRIRSGEKIFPGQF